MDLKAVVNKAKTLSVDDLALDRDFEGPIHPQTILAASRVAFALNRPYVHPDKDEFVRTHKQQLARLIYNLAHWEEMNATIALPRRERILIAAWHFPEIATVFAFAKKIHALLLVSQDPPWFEALRKSGCTLNIFEPGAARQLVQEMRAGRVVAAMLDHSYPNTQGEPSRLLGRTVNTPSGVLKLCSQCGYLIVFPAPRPEGIEVVAQLDATGRSVSDLAQQYNDWLEQEVKRSPAKWLMWQALPLR